LTKKVAKYGPARRIAADFHCFVHFLAVRQILRTMKKAAIKDRKRASAGP